MKWFDVDREGLAKLLERKGRRFVIYELIQNAWDEDSSEVEVTFKWDGTRRRATLVVEDDNPTGFADLTHAFTLFAESTKKGDPEKRGRFNLGEKLVLACCEEASIMTTTGGVVFDSKGRHRKRTRRKAGSVFSGVIPMLKTEFQEIVDGIDSLIPPGHIETTFNGEPLKRPRLVKAFQAKRLLTELSGEDGILKRTRRGCEVRLYRTTGDDPAYLYEMGIPVVELEEGDPWHVDVQQKVPLTMDRENVIPSYLRDLRLRVLNEMHDELSESDANAGWAREAAKEEEASDEAVKTVLDLRFGECRVAYDPSDQEANMIAASKGYTVVTGSQLSKEEWRNAKRTGTLLPAGRVTPSPKIEVSSHGGRDVSYDESRWSEAMHWVVAHTVRVGSELIGRPIKVTIVNDLQGPYGACFGNCCLEFNVGRLGRRWFVARAKEGPLSVKLNKLIIHELGHHYSGNHLSEDYHDALCELGAKLAVLVANDNAVPPEVFQAFEEGKGITSAHLDDRGVFP